jgi:RNA polymerase sigma-70 factor (ECF subfamily)
MAETERTRWSVIQAAAEGDVEARSTFARRYEPVARAYLDARWRGRPLAQEIDDAVQEVFVDCFRDHGALTRVDPERGEFRGFLFGVIRKVALRVEERHARRLDRPAGSEVDLGDLLPTEDHLSRVLDGAWARTLLAQAGALQRRRAEAKGSDAVRRLDLLRLRFRDDHPVREIARLWGETPERVHREYARARDEFKAALREVVREHHGGEPRSVEQECVRLLECLRR